MPRTTIVDMPAAEQARLLAEMRRARDGSLVALHIVPLCAAQRTPTEIATVLFCSRSTVYRVVKAYLGGQLEWAGAEERTGGRRRPMGRAPALQRSVLAILSSVPRLCGWWRTRWSCATIALELQARRGLTVSAETVRRWLHALDWEWKRAKRGAKDDDPPRVEKLARIRLAFEHLRVGVALLFADEVDIGLLPKVGSQWMPKGARVEAMTPGTNENRYLAGALAVSRGTIAHCVWYSKTTGLFLDLLHTLDCTYPAAAFTRLTVVADTAESHHAGEVEKGLATHPRFELLYLPASCPRANPLERAFGDVHDKCTRHHLRKRIRDLVGDVEEHLQRNGPWPDALSEIYYTPGVTAAVQALLAAETAPQELSQLAA